jgi:hypothetical protein
VTSVRPKGRTVTPSLPSTLSAAAFARALGLDRNTVQAWCQEGRIKAYRAANTWRIQPGELERVIAIQVTTQAMRRRPAGAGKPRRDGRRSGKRYALPVVGRAGGNRAAFDAALDAELQRRNSDPDLSTP